MSYELRVSYKLQVLCILFLASCILHLASYDVPAVALDERYKPLYDELSDKFMCLCGCGSTVKTCPHEQCGFAIPFKKELSERVQKGETKEQIIKYFIDKHGEKILSSPTKKGFNLMAWITPFAAIIIAGFLIKKVINKWTVRQKSEDRSQKTEVVEDKYKKMLKKELEEFE
ncbi:MAG: cytochrome c-type biogenesis protein CcmH [Nitrospinae bacterium]|nr:cytochrome c-type biogenesis protein CcmH [Nitrospinota bacterium]